MNDPVRYRSNLTAPDLEPAFAHAVPIAHRNCAGHVSLCDPELFEGCGYMSNDEAAILYNIAKAYPGPFVEVGSHTGWSAAHVAASGNHVDAIDPEYSHPMFNKTKDPAKFLARTRENLERAGVADRVGLHGCKSREFFSVPRGPFTGAVIDGEHEPPHPVRDAEMVLPCMADTCVVVFHDGHGGPVRDGIDYMAAHGFGVKRYKTPQLLTACWRGEDRLPDHTPDPSFDWSGWLNQIGLGGEVVL